MGAPRRLALQPLVAGLVRFGWVLGLAGVMVLTPRALGGEATPAGPGLAEAKGALETEHIFICCIYGPDAKGTNAAITALKNIGARANGAVWTYTNTLQQKTYVIHMVLNASDMIQALYTDKAHLVIRGHSNYGLGGVFATSREFTLQRITDIRFTDDQRLMSYSSPWVAVNVPKLLAHQSYPNWWPVFQDGTSTIMPYDFNDPQGDPPYNYLLTYQLPGDPTWYKIETVNNSPLERFPDSDNPAWYAADGSRPDPGNPDHLQYYFVNTNAAFEAEGKWLVSTNGGRYVGTNYLSAPAGTGLSQVGWFFSIPTPGTYSVFACWPAAAANVSSAQYLVTHALGVTTVKMNQKINGGRWNKLGNFLFDAG
jgi:hypothetical protein